MTDGGGRLYFSRCAAPVDRDSTIQLEEYMKDRILLLIFTYGDAPWDVEIVEN